MSRQRGLALVSVLWGVAILSLIAAAMLSASLTSAHIDRNDWDRTRANSIADSAVNLAILSLLDDRAARQPRVDAMPADFSIDGVPVRLWIADESGKINVNFADKDLLKAALAAAGVESGDAAALADRIVARRDPKAGPIAFRSLDELLAVPGMTRDVLARAQSTLTVFGKNPQVNTQAASRQVLRLLPGMTADAVDRVLKGRDEIRATLSQTSDNAAGSPLGIADAVFLVTAEVHAGTANVVRSAAVRFTGDPARPYLIVAWR